MLFCHGVRAEVIAPLLVAKETEQCAAPGSKTSEPNTSSQTGNLHLSPEAFPKYIKVRCFIQESFAFEKMFLM